jgi:hypothetical protein
MTRSLSDYLYRLISYKIKVFEPINASVKGSFKKYEKYLISIPEDQFWYKNFDTKLSDGRQIKVRYKHKDDMYIQIIDNNKLYKYLTIYILKNGNRVIFISKTTPIMFENEDYEEEKSEYTYNLERENYIFRYTKISSLKNQIITMNVLYNKEGIEEKRSIDSNTIEITNVITKRLKKERF